jgi:hypothetical protein
MEAIASTITISLTYCFLSPTSPCPRCFQQIQQMTAPWSNFTYPFLLWLFLGYITVKRSDAAGWHFLCHFTSCIERKLSYSSSSSLVSSSNISVSHLSCAMIVTPKTAVAPDLHICVQRTMYIMSRLPM